jgi:hypothetical protein
MGRSLCRACLDLIADWWRADRVRISPREGELLRLQPICLAMIEGRLVEVLGRQEVQSDQAHSVRYECRTEEGPAHLEVRFSENTGRLEIGWSISDRSEALSEHQIEIFG